MVNLIARTSGQLIRKFLPLLFSVLGHVVVITVVLFAWRSFKASFQDSSNELDQQVFEIEIVSPDALEQGFLKQQEKSPP